MTILIRDGIRTGRETLIELSTLKKNIFSGWFWRKRANARHCHCLSELLEFILWWMYHVWIMYEHDEVARLHKTDRKRRGVFPKGYRYANRGATINLTRRELRKKYRTIRSHRQSRQIYQRLRHIFFFFFFEYASSDWSISKSWSKSHVDYYQFISREWCKKYLVMYKNFVRREGWELPAIQRNRLRLKSSLKDISRDTHHQLPYFWRYMYMVHPLPPPSSRDNPHSKPHVHIVQQIEITMGNLA